jgi:hypothetical protein
MVLATIFEKCKLNDQSHEEVVDMDYFFSVEEAEMWFEMIKEQNGLEDCRLVLVENACAGWV